MWRASLWLRLMVGENGVPVTPDWHPEPRLAPVFDLASRVLRLPLDMPDCWLGEN